MERFILKGVVIFLLLETLFLPLRETLTGWLVLPEGFYSVWECTALDETFLFIAFIVSYPSRKNKLLPLLLGVTLIQLYNGFRIFVVLMTGDPFLHDILFRAGTFLLLLLLFYASFRYLGPPEPSHHPSQ